MGKIISSKKDLAAIKGSIKQELMYYRKNLKDERQFVNELKRKLRKATDKAVIASTKRLIDVENKYVDAWLRGIRIMSDALAKGQK